MSHLLDRLQYMTDILDAFDYWQAATALLCPLVRVIDPVLSFV
jgi:hypothetical protein